MATSSCTLTTNGMDRLVFTNETQVLNAITFTLPVTFLGNVTFQSGVNFVNGAPNGLSASTGSGANTPGA